MGFLKNIGDILGALVAPIQEDEVVVVPKVVKAKKFNHQLKAYVGNDYTTNEPIYVDFAKYGQGLIAGQTGSGKGVASSQMIASLYDKNNNNSPFVFTAIDPKGGLDYGIFTTNKDFSILYNAREEGKREAYNYLVSVYEEHVKRIKVMRELGVRNIGDYNVWATKNSKPLMVASITLIDEYLVFKNELDSIAIKEKNEDGEVIEDIKAGACDSMVSSLTSVGRASGTHVVIMTQSPYAEIVTSTIKGNATWKIGLNVSNSRISNTIGFESNKDLKGEEFKAYESKLPHKIKSEKGVASILLGSSLSKMRVPFAKNEDGTDEANNARLVRLMGA